MLDRRNILTNQCTIEWLRKHITRSIDTSLYLRRKYLEQRGSFMEKKRDSRLNPEKSSWRRGIIEKINKHGKSWCSNGFTEKFRWSGFESMQNTAAYVMRVVACDSFENRVARVTSAVFQQWQLRGRQAIDLYRTGKTSICRRDVRFLSVSQPVAFIAFVWN